MIPIIYGGAPTDELNSFVAGNRIVHIKRRWTSDFAILQTADEA